MFKSKKEKVEEEILKEELNETPGNEDDSAEEGTDIEISDGEKSIEEKYRELEEKSAELRDQLLRKAAEFENYKRRAEAEIANIYKYASENLMLELLPVLDDFDRMMSSWNDKTDLETMKKGAQIIYDKFKLILQKQGLKEIESEGKPFDVNLHDAMLQMENDKLKPNTVINVVEKGYFLKEKVLRHSKVVVSKKSEKEKE